MWALLGWSQSSEPQAPVAAWRATLQDAVQAYERVLAELTAQPRFQRRRAAAEVGYGPDLVAALRQRLDRALATRSARDTGAVFTLLCTNSGRACVRCPAAARLARTVFYKALELHPALPLDVELRQLFPSAPPLLKCDLWDAGYVELPPPPPQS